MGVPKPIPLHNGFYQSEALPVASQFCQNMYVNIPETDGAISESQLYPTPGLVELVSTGDTEINRGAHKLNDAPYYVNANTLYRLESDLITMTSLGTIAGSGRVSMADNGTQLIIVVPGTRVGYIYTVAGGLVLIADAVFTDVSKAAPEIVVFISGYFVVTRGSKEFFSSNLNNGFIYDALDFAAAEADPDKIRSAHVHKNQLYIFGSETIEVYQVPPGGNGVDFPFQRINGFVIPKGIAAPFSVTEFDGTFCFIGQGVNESPKIYIFTGNDVEPISTTSIDLFLQQGVLDIPDAFVWNYTFRGATFVGWSNKNGTFVFDSKASGLSGKKIWHQRVSRNLQAKTRWRVNSLVTAYGELLVGDSESGIIGKIDNSVYVDYGSPIVRDFALPTLENNSQPMFFNSVEAVLDSGQGLEDGTIPKIRLLYSDNGRVYKSRDELSAGKVGEYERKTKWQQLGSTRRYRILRLKMDAPTKWVVLKVVVDIDV